MSNKFLEAEDRTIISLVYDENFNITDIREFSPLAKGAADQAEQVVKVTKLFYDSDFNLTQIRPNYKTDKLLNTDLNP